MEKDPSQAFLEVNETAMLVFVIKAMKSPGSVMAEDIQVLKDLGWEERDMVDALAQGVSMIDHSIMMQAFQIDTNCLAGNSISMRFVISPCVYNGAVGPRTIKMMVGSVMV